MEVRRRRAHCWWRVYLRPGCSFDCGAEREDRYQLGGAGRVYLRCAAACVGTSGLCRATVRMCILPPSLLFLLQLQGHREVCIMLLLDLLWRYWSSGKWRFKEM